MSVVREQDKMPFLMEKEAVVPTLPEQYEERFWGKKINK